MDETQETTQENQTEMFDLSKPLKKEVVGLFIDKKTLVGNPTEFIIKGIGKNQFKKPFLQVITEDNDLLRNLNLSKTKFNELIDKLGEDPKQWVDKVITIEGSEEEYEIKNRETGLPEIKTGVELAFKV